MKYKAFWRDDEYIASLTLQMVAGWRSGKWWMPRPSIEQRLRFIYLLIQED